MDNQKHQQMLSIISNSEKNAWVIDEILPENFLFDTSKQFIPMIIPPGGNELSKFTASEVTLISQLHAIEYTRLIHLVEEFIVDIALVELKGKTERDPVEVRMLSRFIDEEVKHQLMFNRFGNILKKQINDSIKIPSNEISFSKKVMTKHPLSVWLLALHGEITTHFHYTDIFKLSLGVEPKFVELLKYHWMEESQHVRVDIIEMNNILLSMSEEQKKIALNDYIELLVELDKEMFNSADILIQNFQICTGSKSEQVGSKDLLKNFLVRTLRNFLVYVAFRHPTVLNTIKLLDKNFNPKIIQDRIESQALVG